MEDVWIDAIDQYLKGDEWCKVVDNFMDQHCAFFPGGTDYTVGQHGIYLEFRQIAERVIASVLDRLGCTEDQFAEALEMKLKQPETGPRDAQVKSVMQTLLEVDDFEAFCVSMAKRNGEMEEQELTVIAQKKSEDQATPGNKAQSSKHMESTDSLALAFNGATQAKAVSDDDVQGSSSEEESDDEDSLPPEWEVQVAAAMGILEARYRGTLTDEQEALLPWAQAVMAARDEMNREGSSVERVNELEQMVMDAKFSADLAVANKKAAKAAGSWNVYISPDQPAEEALAKLLDVSDRLRNAIAKARSKTMYHDEAKMTQETLESLYLFLKEKVQGNRMETDALEIKNFIKTTISKKEEKGLGSILLWLYLEKKAGMLEKAIRQAVSGEQIQSVVEGSDAISYHVDLEAYQEKGEAAAYTMDDWEERVDPTSGHVYYQNLLTGESGWDPPECGYKPLDVSQVPEYEGWVWNDELQEWEFTLDDEALGAEGYDIELEFENQETQQSPAYSIDLEDGAEMKCLSLKVEDKSDPSEFDQIEEVAPTQDDVKSKSDVSRGAASPDSKVLVSPERKSLRKNQLLKNARSISSNSLGGATPPAPPTGLLPVRDRFLPPIKNLRSKKKKKGGKKAKVSKLDLGEAKGDDQEQKSSKEGEREEEKPLTSRNSMLSPDAFKFLLETQQSLQSQNEDSKMNES